MNPLKTNYLWQIHEANLPELHFKLSTKAPFSHSLPTEFQAKVKSSGYEKAYNDYFTQTYSTEKNVLVLPIRGELTRSSYWGFGNEFFIRQLNAAAKDPDYVGAVMDVDSGGGTADSSSEFAQAVANFRKVKPINAVTAYACSAAYYIISPCNEIYVIDQAASSLGSIGTLIILENYVEYLKMQGIDVKIIRATASVDKALINPYEIPSEKALAQLQIICDACQKEFAGDVKRYRGGKINSNEVFTGKVFGPDGSIANGLADKKGDRKAAIQGVLAQAA